jgi:hypothetical protein
MSAAAKLDAVLLKAHLAILRVSLDNARQAVFGLQLSVLAAGKAKKESAALLAWWREDLARLEAEEARVLALING